VSVSVTVTKQTVTIDDGRDIVTVSPVTQSVAVSSVGAQGATGATGATGPAGPAGTAGASGVVSVNAPITNSGTSGSANLSITAASTSAAGVAQLTDSPNSTSTTTAATPNAVLQSMKNYQNAAYNSTARIGNIANWGVTGGLSNTSGVIYHSRHIAERNFTVSNISFITSTTASSGLTVARFGIYTRSGTTFTLVARTASDTTIFNTTNTRFTRALDTTGGYPATYDFVAGNEYWVSVIQVGTTPGNVLGTGSTSTAINNAFGVFVYQDAGEADLAATSTGSTGTLRIYSEVS
jgi:hypothetical protein